MLETKVCQLINVHGTVTSSRLFVWRTNWTVAVNPVVSGLWVHLCRSVIRMWWTQHRHYREEAERQQSNRATHPPLKAAHVIFYFPVFPLHFKSLSVHVSFCSLFKESNGDSYSVQIDFTAAKSGEYVCSREILYPPPFRKDSNVFQVRVAGKAHTFFWRTLQTKSQKETKTQAGPQKDNCTRADTVKSTLH